MFGSPLTFPNINPSNSEVICELPEATDELVDQAIDAATNAFQNGWGNYSRGKRQALLFRLAELCEKHLEEFAKLESLDNAVPIKIVKRFSVQALVKNLRYFAEWIDKMPGENVALTGSGALDYTIRESYGVAGILTAYNTPSLFLGSKVGPA